MKKPKVEEVVRIMSNYLNCGGGGQALAEELAKEHRTLIQLIYGVFISLTEKLADDCDKGRYDGRNEQSCKMAKEICDKIKNRYLPYV